MSLKVIGAGHGRTGTLSLKHALEQLGFAKCYHMVELLKHPDDVPYWEAAERGGPVDWDALFQDCQAAVDFPAYRQWETLLRAYPDAKVILTTRDPEAWWASTEATIYRAGSGFRDRLRLGVQLPFSARARKLLRVFKLAGGVWQKDFGGRFEDKQDAMRRFRAHEERVRASVPAGQLLVYEVKEGWEPLCVFLGVPVPDAPFPHHNDRQTFQANQKRQVGGVAGEKR